MTFCNIQIHKVSCTPNWGMDPNQWQMQGNRSQASSFHINQLIMEPLNNPKAMIIHIKSEAIAHIHHLQTILLATINHSFNLDRCLKLQIWLLRCKMKFTTRLHKCLTIASLFLHMASPNPHLNHRQISLIKLVTLILCLTASWPVALPVKSPRLHQIKLQTPRFYWWTYFKLFKKLNKLPQVLLLIQSRKSLLHQFLKKKKTED